jgi:hypothetical protein
MELPEEDVAEIPRRDAANQELSYAPYTNGDFPKIAQESELSQDIRDWPATILQEFASQHPYAFQATAPEIEFEKIDEKTGTAFGAIILRKPYQVTGLGSPRERLEQEPEKVAVPVIIENFRLKPFEIFIRGEKVQPLTETRFAETNGVQGIANGLDPYFQPSPLFLDKMIPPTVGYLGNLYGNYSLSGGEGDYSNWVPAKGASEKFEPRMEKRSGSADQAKERTFIDTIRATIAQTDWEHFRRWCGDERLVCGFDLNKTMNIVREIMGVKPTSFDDYLDFIEKSAPVHLVRLCRLSSGRWRATEVNDYFYKPVTRELSPEEVVARYGPMEPRVGSLMQGSGEILLESSERAHVRPIVLEDHEVCAEYAGEDGHYLAVTKDGGFVEGQIFTKVCEYSGNVYPAKLFTSGNAYSLQDEIVGHRLGDVSPTLKSGSVEVGVEGTFAGEIDGAQCALLPFRVTNVGFMRTYMVIQAIGVSNEQLTFVMMPGVTRFVYATGIADSSLGSLLAGNVIFIPPSFHFIPLGKKVRLHDDPREVKDVLSKKIFLSERHLEPFSVETTRKGHSRALRVISGKGGFVLKGAILETMRRDAELDGLSATDCHFIMSVLGVPLMEGARITALALDRGEVNVANLRPAKDVVARDRVQDRALAELAAVFRRNLMKEASTIGDPKAVDAMLSLNFVNESNLIQFLQNIPMFREVEEKLAELYLYSALGLKSQVPENAALSAMKSVNEVTEHLEYLAAMLRTPASRAQTEAIA